jgi:seryl-tRNA synthetase
MYNVVVRNQKTGGIGLKNKFLKFSTVFLASTILLQPLTMSSAQVKAATTEKNNDQQAKEEYIKYKEAWIKAINEMPDSDFKDPSVKQELKNNIAASEERGKVTLAAKAAGKSLQAILKKVGEKGWNNLVKKVENTTGTELVALHYDGITRIVNLLANSQEKATTVISKQLVRSGLNKNVADVAAAAFVQIIL